MPVTYPALYTDVFGRERTIIENDSKLLRMYLRGVEFVTRDFYNFRPANKYSELQLASIDLFEGDLCSYSLECDIPVWVTNNQSTYQTLLHVHIEHGKPAEGHDILQLTMNIEDQTYRSSGRLQYDSFDEQLTELAKLLPKGFHLKICWTCAFSDYNPSGSGAFGRLACFRNTKEQYLQTRTKNDLNALWDIRAEDVQEVYLCQEYVLRRPGSGLYIGEEYTGKRG
jgi:hypothetical protein